MDLVERIKMAQQERGWKDVEFSKRLKLNQCSWSLIRRGKRKPSLKFLMAVSRVLPELHRHITAYVIGK